MSNLNKGQIKVFLDQKEYTARLTLDSIVAIEQSTGMGIIKLCTEMANSNVSLSSILTVLHKGLRGGGNDLSEKEVKAIVEEVGIIESTRAVAQMLTDTLTRTNSDEDDTKKNEE